MTAIISNRRGPESLAGLVRRLGDGAIAANVRETAQEEIVLLALPWSELAEALSIVADWEGRIVIDATNPASPAPGQQDPAGRGSSEIVSDLVPGAQLIKAFNTLPSRLLIAHPEEAGGRRVMFFSGDHARAKAAVGRMIARMGFAGIDLGRLAEGGRLQQFPTGPLAGLNLVRIATTPPVAGP
jgi:8-hydroxy-5-deazaflavin:NADPH oxidoreductase